MPESIQLHTTGSPPLVESTCHSWSPLRLQAFFFWIASLMLLLHVSFFQFPLQKPLWFTNISVYPHIGSPVDESNIKRPGDLDLLLQLNWSKNSSCAEGRHCQIINPKFHRSSSIHDRPLQLHSFLLLLVQLFVCTIAWFTATVSSSLILYIY